MEHCTAATTDTTKPSPPPPSLLLLPSAQGWQGPPSDVVPVRRGSSRCMILRAICKGSPRPPATVRMRNRRGPCRTQGGDGAVTSGLGTQDSGLGTRNPKKRKSELELRPRLVSRRARSVGVHTRVRAVCQWRSHSGYWHWAMGLVAGGGHGQAAVGATPVAKVQRHSYCGYDSLVASTLTDAAAAGSISFRTAVLAIGCSSLVKSPASVDIRRGAQGLVEAHSGSRGAPRGPYFQVTSHPSRSPVRASNAVDRTRWPGGTHCKGTLDARRPLAQHMSLLRGRAGFSNEPADPKISSTAAPPCIPSFSWVPIRAFYTTFRPTESLHVHWRRLSARQVRHGDALRRRSAHQTAGLAEKNVLTRGAAGAWSHLGSEWITESGRGVRGAQNLYCVNRSLAGLNRLPLGLT
ncbi:hypothetical protein C8Q78DRAFT_425785 [Trametes maxima]|nr:hypothetical protein C8Q78DRAFT_425785 [Trametes maxima]